MEQTYVVLCTKPFCPTTLMQAKGLKVNTSVDRTIHNEQEGHAKTDQKHSDQSVRDIANDSQSTEHRDVGEDEDH